jgi:tetratricopeptide (TPR) repeat protein
MGHRHSRLRYFVFVGAGPVASAALGLAAVMVCKDLDLVRSDWQLHLAVAAGLTILISVYLSLMSLVPHQIAGLSGDRLSDGLVLWHVIARPDFDKHLAARACMGRGIELLHAGNRAKALRWFRRAARNAELRGDPDLRVMVAGIIQEQGELLDEATEIFREVLKTPATASNISRHMQAADGLASLALYHGLKHLFPEALQNMEQAVAASPDVITLQGTLGALFFETGKVAAAEAMLLTVRLNSPSPLDRGISAAYLAAIAQRKGNGAAAQRFLTEANANAGEHRCVRRVLGEAGLLRPCVEAS